MENTMQTAETILSQINASDFWARARWGVKESLATEKGIQFNCTKRIKILIDLEANDTYTVTTGRMSGRFDFKVASEQTGFMAGDLVRAIDRAFSAAFGTV